MNKLFLVGVLCVGMASMGASACAQKKKTGTKSSNTKNAAAKSEKKNITYLKMSRGACFGKCPTYDIEIFESGLVRYTGRMFVEKTGIYEKQFTRENAASLFKQFAEERVDTMQDKYAVMVSDLPSLGYELIIDGVTKTIMNANFGPKSLGLLSKEIDYSVGQPDFSWKLISKAKE